jgi:hypothetical protein
MMIRSIVALSFLLIPYSSSAAISISEIAWMGSQESANHEWIELHNDGASQDVSGWQLTDGQNLSITLEGVVPAHAHIVLERTSEASAAGSAFMVYTGALVNSGATLQLLRADGTVVDQISGGKDWSLVGGDNTTKETAQYTNVGWVTARATPAKNLERSEIDTVNQEPIESDAVVTSTTSNTPSQKSSAGEPVRLVVPGVTLKLDIDAQTIGYVHQPIAFDVTATGIGTHLVASLAYDWNFGNGMTAIHKKTEHIFKFPGTYVVTAYAGYKRQEQVARHEITILPITVSLTTNTNGDVQVNNDSPYEIDVSGYRLRAGELFVFPARSIMLPNQTITISTQRLGDTHNQLVGIYDTENVLLDTLLPGRFDSSFAVEVIDDTPTPHISALSVSRETVLSDDSNFSFAETEPTIDVPQSASAEEEQTPSSTISADTQVAAVGSTKQTLPVQWPYWALAVVLIVGTIGVYIVPRREEPEM